MSDYSRTNRNRKNRLALITLIILMVIFIILVMVMLRSCGDSSSASVTIPADNVNRETPDVYPSDAGMNDDNEPCRCALSFSA